MAKTELKFAASECPIEQVVVYQDRAEITRKVSISADALTAEGSVVKVVVHGLSSRLDGDSVRVKCFGPATIIDVGAELAYGTAAGSSDKEPERAGLQEELRLCGERLVAANAALARTARERQLLNQYCSTALSPTVSTAGSGPTPPAAAAVADPATIGRILDFFAERAEAEDTREAAQSAEKAELEKQIAELNAQLALTRQQPQRRSHHAINVRLSLHPHLEPKAADAESASAAVSLYMTYMVSGASWSPSYDARAAVEREGAMSLQLSYFGLVVNSTEEDWLGTRLALSTASPASGGVPPALPTLLVGWQHQGFRGGGFGGGGCLSDCGRNPVMPRGCAMPVQSTMAPPQAMCCNAALQTLELKSCSLRCDAPSQPSLSVASAATVSAGAARFEVEHVSTVLSDSAAHKVTLALLELRPSVRHFAAPEREARAYLQASAVNTSAFALLASANCAVFLDGSFVCKSRLPLTMPGESLTLFLGPDPAIKVESRPAVTKDVTVGEGSLFRSTVRQTLTEQTVTLTNTRSDRAARVHVAMVMPRSQDEKIKVTPVQPSAAELQLSDAAGLETERTEGQAAGGERGSSAVEGGSAVVAVQNRATNNIVFMCSLPPGGKHTLSFKYRVEHPADRPIEYTQQPAS